MELKLVGFLFLFLSSLTFALLLLKRKLYFAAAGNIVFGCYEGLAPLAIALPDEMTDQRILTALANYSSASLPEAWLLSSALFGLVLLTNGMLLGLQFALIDTPLALGSSETRRSDNVASARLDDTIFIALCLAILVCGLIAFNDNAGVKRLGDYIGGDAQISTSFFHYGIILLPAVWLAMWVAYEDHRYLLVLAGLASCAPLLYEIYISSRRQFLLPIPVVLLLYWSYSGVTFKVVRRRAIILLIFFSVIFYAQYATRLLTQMDQNISFAGVAESINPENLIVETLSPSIAEMVAIATITNSVFSTITENQITFGAQLVVGVLNSIPFLKLGDAIFPGYMDALIDGLVIFAPYGAFPVAAELILSFGPMFFPFIGALIIGCVLYIAEYSLSRPSGSFRSVDYVVFTYFAVILVKYRSGLVDIVLYTMPHILICGGVVLLGLFISRFTAKNSTRRSELRHSPQMRGNKNY